MAVRSSNVNGAYLLLAHHAKPDTPDIHGDTALLWLMKNLEADCAIDLIRLLLRFGADLAVEGAPLPLSYPTLPHSALPYMRTHA